MVVEALEQLRRAPQYKASRAGMYACMHACARFAAHVHMKVAGEAGKLGTPPGAAAPCQHTHCRGIATHNSVWTAPATCVYLNGVLWCAAAASAQQPSGSAMTTLRQFACAPQARQLRTANDIWLNWWGLPWRRRWFVRRPCGVLSHAGPKHQCTRSDSRGDDSICTVCN